MREYRKIDWLIVQPREAWHTVNEPGRLVRSQNRETKSEQSFKVCVFSISSQFRDVFVANLELPAWEVEMFFS